MSAAGRGGQSDVGQRVRDEILAVQSRNRCKVGRRWCCSRLLVLTLCCQQLSCCPCVLGLLHMLRPAPACLCSCVCYGCTAGPQPSFDLHTWTTRHAHTPICHDTTPTTVD